FYHVADVETLPQVFEKELGELKSIVARDIVIEIRCPEGVRPLRILGRPGELSGREESIVLATLSGGQTRNLYVECQVEKGGVGKVSELAEVAVRYVDPASLEKRSSGSKPVVVGWTDDAKLSESSINRAVEAEAVVFDNSLETEKALALADSGDVA